MPLGILHIKHALWSTPIPFLLHFISMNFGLEKVKQRKDCVFVWTASTLETHVLSTHICHLVQRLQANTCRRHSDADFPIYGK